MGEVKEEMKEKVRGMVDTVVKIEDVVSKIKGMSNWKAPEPGGVQGYWFKAFDCVRVDGDWEDCVDPKGSC